MLKLKNKKVEAGFTLIELLEVAAIIGILLALAIPNLLKARISANEANARKALQTLRDAEAEYFEQDLDEDGSRDFTGLITGDNSLRDPDGGGIIEEDALIDSSFDGANSNGGTADSCVDDKAGYCLTYSDEDGLTHGDDATDGLDDYGWDSSMNSYNKTGRRDFGTYGDGVIRCTVDPALNTRDPGTYIADRTHGACD